MPARISKSRFEPAANVLAGGLALALVLTPRLVPPCARMVESAAPMHCHWTFQVDSLLALAALPVAAALWLVRHAEARQTVGGTLALFGFLVIAVTQPWVIGLCGNPDMPCHHTAHWLWLWSGLLMADGIAIAVRARASAGRPVPADPWEAAQEIPKGAKSCCD
jgi:hypothetical protein